MKRYGLMLPTLLLVLLTTACAMPAAALQQEPQVDVGGASADESGVAASPEVGYPAADDGNSMKVVEAATSAAAAASFYALQPGLSSRSTRGHVWAEPIIDGDSVTVSLSVASLDDHVHFELPDGDAVVGFVAYFVDGQFLVRAEYCPACGSDKIEWGGSLVVCRSCGSTFDAVTGEGDGEKDFPSGSIPYSIDGNSITLSLSDLTTAHARTVDGEATLLEVPIVVEDEDDGDTSWPRCCRR